MTTPRERKWMSPQGLAGGLAMFAAEAAVVAALAAAAWVVSIVILSIL